MAVFFAINEDDFDHYWQQQAQREATEGLLDPAEEIQQVLKGKLPRPADMEGDPLRGEVQAIWEQLVSLKRVQRRRSDGTRSVFTRVQANKASAWFAPKGTKVDLDELRRDINEQYQFAYLTPAEMLESLDLSLRGIPQHPETASQSGEREEAPVMGATFSVGGTNEAQLRQQIVDTTTKARQEVDAMNEADLRNIGNWWLDVGKLSGSSQFPQQLKGKTIEEIAKHFDNILPGLVVDNKYPVSLTVGDQTALIFDRGGFVWVDVSAASGMSAYDDLSHRKKASLGAVAYQIAEAYAFNTGKKFAPDPNGVSEIAWPRRWPQLLSSAVRFQSTKHLDGSDDASRWKDGDDALNIGQLAAQELAYVQHFVPEIKGLKLSPDGSKILDGRGVEIAIGDLQSHLPGGSDAVAFGIGETTLRRAVATQSANSGGQMPAGQVAGSERGQQGNDAGDFGEALLSQPGDFAGIDRGHALEHVTYSVGSARDAEYLAAVEAGDMEAVQQMVDKAARVAGYAVGPVYHYTNNEFDTFERGERAGLSGKGIYFSEDGMPLYGRRKVSAYLKIASPLTYKMSYEINGVREINSAGHKTKVIPDIFERFPHYDAVIGKDEIVVPNPNQIKSADPVTYDEAGKVIPLSERFNHQDERITFSVSARDAEYQEAYEKGNDAKALELVQERAKAAGYVVPSYHGTEADFDIFSKQGKGSRALGFFFTSDKSFAENYGKASSFLLNLGRSKKVSSEWFDAHNTRENVENGFWEKYRVQLERDGFDSVEIVMDEVFARVRIRRSDYVLFSSNQAKRSDPFTFDSDGNLIPLSQRFNPADDRITHSVGSASRWAEHLDRLVERRLGRKPQEREVRWSRARQELAGVAQRFRAKQDALGLGEGDTEALRLDISRSLTSVRAILAVVPAEYRGKVPLGGIFARVIEAKTDRGRLRALGDLIERVDTVLEEALAKEFREQIRKLFEQARPKLTEARNLRGKGVYADESEMAGQLEACADISLKLVKQRLKQGGED